MTNTLDIVRKLMELIDLQRKTNIKLDRMTRLLIKIEDK